MSRLFYYNINTDSWKGTRLFIAADDIQHAFRLQDKIIETIQSDADEDVRDYRFCIGRNPDLMEYDTVFHIADDRNHVLEEECNKLAILYIFLTAEDGTGITPNVMRIGMTDWRFLRAIESSINLSDCSDELREVIKYRQALRNIINIE